MVLHYFCMDIVATKLTVSDGGVGGSGEMNLRVADTGQVVTERSLPRSDCTPPLPLKVDALQAVLTASLAR